MKYTIHYTLRADGPEGEVIEATVPEEPFNFEAGGEDILEDLEAAVLQAKVGESFELTIPSDRAYGPEMEGAFAVLPKTQFVDEEGLDDTVMEEGEVVVMRDDTGEELHGVVMGVTEEEVEVDFNHPLAGIDLHFSVQLMSVENDER
jgi:FKBP-type peptidyl-prolyl cis-trans isomerase SlyD